MAISCLATARPSAAFSFPGIGKEGPGNIAVALFSFPTVEGYETYRREVANDPDCLAATSDPNRTVIVEW